MEMVEKNNARLEANLQREGDTGERTERARERRRPGRSALSSNYNLSELDNLRIGLTLSSSLYNGGSHGLLIWRRLKKKSSGMPQNYR